MWTDAIVGAIAIGSMVALPAINPIDQPDTDLEMLITPDLNQAAMLPYFGRIYAIGDVAVPGGVPIVATDDMLFVDGLIHLPRTGTVPANEPDIGGDPVYGNHWVLDMENSAWGWQLQIWCQPTPARASVDFDGNGVVDSNDFFAYSEAFFGANQ